MLAVKVGAGLAQAADGIASSVMEAAAHAPAAVTSEPVRKCRRSIHDVYRFICLSDGRAFFQPAVLDQVSLDLDNQYIAHRPFQATLNFSNVIE